VIRNRMIFRSLWLPVFIVFITIFIPNTLFAGPSPKCPCFSAGEIERAISKAVDVDCVYYSNPLPEVIPSTVDSTVSVDIARINIFQNTGIVQYSMFGDLEAKLGMAYPSCGTSEGVFDIDSNGAWVVNSGKYRIDMQDINDQNSAQACFDAIIQAYTGCEDTSDNICRVLDGFVSPDTNHAIDCKQ